MFYDMISDMESNENQVLLLLNCFEENKNSIFYLFLSHNLILKCLKL